MHPMHSRGMELRICSETKKTDGTEGETGPSCYCGSNPIHKLVCSCS